LIAYFDCFSGISGDMALGALLDVGADPAILDAAVEALGLAGEVSVERRREERGHLGGTRVLVKARPGPSRTVPELQAAVSAPSLPQAVRERAGDAVRRLGEAESRLHGQPVEKLHLHELGGADTLVDLVGAFWLLDSLGVTALHASPLPAPRGLLEGMPLPAPASLRVLEGTGAVLVPDERETELVTPTGAAILAAAARFQRPAMALSRVGYGIGARELPGNALALWLGEPAAEAAEVAVIETNLDDMPPNLLAALVQDLMAAGALDVSVAPALMKKGRPGHLLAVMAEPARAADLAGLVLRASSTFGLRLSRAERVVAGRRSLEVETAYGRVRVKLKELGGEVVDAFPEYEDCRRAAAASGVDTGRVMREAAAEARRRLGLA
jgi:uncharacterized protein (TIGR00299 family) protein